MIEISSMLRRASATTALCCGPTFVDDLQEGERFNIDAAGVTIHVRFNMDAEGFC